MEVPQLNLTGSAVRLNLHALTYARFTYASFPVKALSPSIYDNVARGREVYNCRY